MFSPIPFLPSGDSDALGEPMMDVDGSGDDGLMSPLMLSDSPGVFASQQAGGRSPTPEPEDEAEMGENECARDKGGEMSGDPGHQPYLGRVDELDSGPLTTNGHQVDADGEERATGVGEAGNMTPHGMSDQPVPLSSTTVIGEGAREIAPMPRRSASREPEEKPEVKEEGEGGNKEEDKAEAKEEVKAENDEEDRKEAEGDEAKAGGEEAKEEAKTE